jgi:hypothetical protein
MTALHADVGKSERWLAGSDVEELNLEGTQVSMDRWQCSRTWLLLLKKLIQCRPLRVMPVHLLGQYK